MTKKVTKSKTSIKNKDLTEKDSKFSTCLILIIIASMLVSIATFKVYRLITDRPAMPNLDLNTWWGPIDKKNNQDTSIRPYRIVFSDSMEQLLYTKFEYYRMRAKVCSFNETNFTYGFNSDALAKVFDYWRFNYKIKEREKYFNKYNHYLTNIQGLDIHFVRVKPIVGENVKIFPILLLHGWAGSIKEFYEVIPYLTNKRQGYDFVFEVIVPSLPGFGYSQASVRPGLNPIEVAIIMQKLMERIGFKQYYIQGGDFGHMVGKNLATLFPESVLGFHTNMVANSDNLAHLVWVLGAIWPSLVVEKEYEDRMYPLSEKLSFYLEEGGYVHMHTTKPDTLGISLQDSPMGLAAYILEKFVVFTDPSFKHLPDGGLTSRYTMTDLLDNVMIYWFTGSITTSMRLYAETFVSKELEQVLNRIPTPVPTWGLRLKHELIYQPDFLLRMKFTNFLGGTTLDEGGHFAALEMPETLADDVFKAVNEILKIPK